MTINNTCFNPFPSSCALNSSMYSNNNSGWNGTGFRRCSQNTPLPTPKEYTQESKEYWDNVHVPCQDQIPMGCEGMMDMMPQFNHDLFQCPDGTIINTKTGKILNGQQNENGYWGNPNKKIKTEVENHWNDRQINSFSMNPIEMQTGVVLTKDDIEYQKHSEEMNKRLKDNMTDYQKELLKDLEDGRFSSKSRLIEESKKCQ